jgi:hypothetical protein|tara:strand:- start:2500 stop:2703 length:204 start_codon:yes stop_codon:yes gene_type:complete
MDSDFVKWNVSLKAEINVDMVLLSKKGDILAAESKAKELLTANIRTGQLRHMNIKPSDVRAYFAKEL